MAKIAIAQNFSLVKRTWRAGCTPSQLFPGGERHQFVKNFLQSLKPTFLISGCARYILLAALHIQSIGFADLNDLLSQLRDALFDRTLHDE